MAEEYGLTVKWLPFNKESWRIEPEDLAALLTPRTKFLALNYASNMTGSINDVTALTALAKTAGALVWIDAVQLGRAQQRVDDGGSLATRIRAQMQVVLAPDGQRPDAVLHHIVVYLVTAVGDVERQFFKDLIGVGDGLLHQRLRRALEDACLHPRLELLDFRISLFLPQGLPALMVGFVVCRVKGIRFRFHIIEPQM